MESKLAELFLTINEFTKQSDKYFAEVSYSACLKELEISIRLKENYEFVEVRKIYTEKFEDSKIDELIEFIKNYKG